MTAFLRTLPPVHAPVTLRGLAAGLREAVTPGDAFDAVESLLRSEYRAREVVLTGSGSDALQLALAVVREAVGPRVALPAFSCFDVASAAVGAAMDPLFYDVDPETLAPVTRSLDEALAQGARSVVLAPLFGLPVPWDHLRELCSSHGALVVEDAAQGHGSAWRTTPSGALGDLSVLSFGRGKGWTGGGGGALLVRGPGLAAPPVPHTARGGDLLSLLRALSQWTFARPSVYGIPRSIPWLGLGRSTYHAPRAPRRLPVTAARLIVSGRRPAADEVPRRRANARWLRTRLEARPAAGVRLVREVPEGRPGYLRFPVLAPGGLTALPAPRRARRLGVEAGYPSALPDLPVFAARGGAGPYEGARLLARDLLTLPTHSGLTPQDRNDLVDLLSTVTAGGGGA